MFDQAATTKYQHTVLGTWGEFDTPAGKVAYVLTKARLGRAGTDNERRLTAQLRPVREVLDTSKLDFNQLLQRDLDDHRVATELLPYLLQPAKTGPSFFPPVMAVLLPFDGPNPVDGFPNVSAPDIEMDEGVRWQEHRFGQSFSAGKLVTNTDEVHSSIKLGRVRWNDELAKLVVLDGQHRAMALIAIDRTLSKTWDTGPGARFRHFYDSRVQKLLGESYAITDLDSIEVPVVVCWFPELHGDGSNAHKAARKLFVDVNKEARQPSEARLTLLSDTELLNIFTRTMLNELRSPTPPLPIYAVEYDNPERDAARPIRWSVLANLNSLKYAVQYTVFGPEKHIKRVDSKFGGRPSWFKMNQRMRDQLLLKDLFPSTIKDDDREIELDSVGNEKFPHSQLDLITGEFMKGWGDAILHVLGNLAPYKAHTKALERLREEWIKDDAMSSLAYDALFEGVGMYWTLRDSYEHWKAQKKRAKDEQRQPPHKPEIAKAWDILAEKAKLFETYRAEAYLGSTNAKSIANAKSFYGLANTHACQLGLFLTIASIAHRRGSKGSKLAGLTATLTASWNTALLSSVNASRDRKLSLSRDDVVKKPLNRIRKMDTPIAAYFRYFWLELLMLPEAQEVWVDHIETAIVEELRDEARTHYLRFLTEEHTKALRASHPSKDQATLRKKARAAEEKALKQALVHWFGVSETDFKVWLDSLEAQVTPDSAPDEGESDDADPPEESESHDEAEEVPLEDLIRQSMPD